ncbi:MAG: hypothetical protein H0T60_15660, partial [Acidobacteria bacterium]|nr:hypothetical protein [Acidobacteriota bacterium]
QPRHVAARIYDRVPAAATQGIEIAVAVAAQLLDLREEFGVVPATIEERYHVAASERRFDKVATEKHRPAENQ